MCALNSLHRLTSTYFTCEHFASTCHNPKQMKIAPPICVSLFLSRALSLALTFKRSKWYEQRTVAIIMRIRIVELSFFAQMPQVATIIYAKLFMSSIHARKQIWIVANWMKQNSIHSGFCFLFSNIWHLLQVMAGIESLKF